MSLPRSIVQVAPESHDLLQYFLHSGAERFDRFLLAQTFGHLGKNGAPFGDLRQFAEHVIIIIHVLLGADRLEQNAQFTGLSCSGIGFSCIKVDMNQVRRVVVPPNREGGARVESDTVVIDSLAEMACYTRHDFTLQSLIKFHDNEALYGLLEDIEA